MYISNEFQIVPNSIMSQLNKPIGYSKNPLIYDSDLENSDLLRMKSLSQASEMVSDSTGVKSSLEELPFEIRANIANQLSQFDCLNLLRTSKTLYSSSIRRLYQHIVIDKDYSQFNYERDHENSNYGCSLEKKEQLSCSFIKSAYGFRRFINPYIHGYTSNGNILFSYVEKIQCIELPDSLNTYEHELNHHLSDFFSQLTHLKELIWLNDQFRLYYLNALPNKWNVTTLVLNIKFTNYLNELPIIGNLDYDSDSSILDEGYSSYFSKLRNFQIRPFDNSTRLQKIVNNFLVSRSDFSVEKENNNLRILKFCRLEKNNHVLFPPCQELVRYDDDILHDDLDLNTVQSIFQGGRLRFMNLTEISLNNCIVVTSDAELLINCVDLGILKTLELKGISEFQKIRQPDSSENITQQLSPSFLFKLAKHLKKLERLYLDYREAYADTVADFLESLASKKLKALDLTIRCNHTKSVSFNEPKELYDAYAHSIVQNERWKTLRTLAIEVKEENAFCDLSITLPRVFNDPISRCKQLRNLRLNMSDNKNLDRFVELVKGLPLLQKLDLFGTQAGGPPHLGLGMIHPTVYDEWYKVQHVAIVFMNQNPSLQYIRINKCIFQCQDGIANPREGITKWFECFVRIGNF